MNDKELMSFAIARSNDPIIKNSVLRDAMNKDLGPRIKVAERDNMNTPDLEQSPDSFLRPGETLEDFNVEFRRPNSDGGKVDEVINAYKRYLGMRKGKQRYKVIPFTTFFEEFARENFADGQLVQLSGDGSRPGYNGDRITVHLVNETGNPNHSGIYKTTNKKTGSVSYRGGYTRRDAGGRQSTKSSPTIKGARELLNKALKIPKGKSMIDLQAEKGAGNMLKDKKFMTQLEKAFEEVSALEKKGYGNIDKIVKKYETKFYKKVGTKNIDGSTVKKGTDNEFTKALRSEIREYARDLDIYNVENPNMEKALNDYRKIKNPKKGMIGNIAERYGIKRGMLDSYITNLGQRKYIPIKDPDEYTKAIRAAEKKAIDKFSDSYFERKLSASKTTGVPFKKAKPNEIVRLQKSHMGDKLTQDVKTSNIGYAAQEINQEVLKDFDTELRKINKDLEKLYKNKPKGYLQEMERLNQRGTDLAAASEGYKKFEAIDPGTGKKFVIPFSSASQELDPSDLLKYDPETNTYSRDTKLASIDKQDKDLVKDLKKTAITSASKTKAQVAADIKKIKSNLKDLNEAEKTRLASMGGKGCNGNFAPGGPVPNKIRCITKALDRLKNPENLGPGDKLNARKLFQSAGAKKFGNFLKGFGIPGEIVFEAAFAIPAFLRGESGKRILGDTLLGFLGAGQSSEEEFVEYAKKKGLSDPTIELISDVNRIVDLGSNITQKEKTGRTTDPTELYNKVNPRGMRNVYKAEVDETNKIFDKYTMDQPQAKQQFNENMFSNAMQLGLDVEDDVQADKDKRIKEREEMGIISNQNYGSFNQVPTGIMGAYKKSYD